MTPAAQCFCSQCGHPTVDFDLTITEVGFVMSHRCLKCHFKIESLVHADILAPSAVS
jgi:hypothetical protein